MTRKDFELIAQALAETGNVGGDGTYLEGWNDAVEEVAETLAERLAETNPAFDRDRFLEAAGVQ